MSTPCRAASSETSVSAAASRTDSRRTGAADRGDVDRVLEELVEAIYPKSPGAMSVKREK